MGLAFVVSRVSRFPIVESIGCEGGGWVESDPGSGGEEVGLPSLSGSEVDEEDVGGDEEPVPCAGLGDASTSPVLSSAAAWATGES